MAQELTTGLPAGVDRAVIFSVANGRVVDDPEQATGGEVLEYLSDGTTRSTLFIC